MIEAILKKYLEAIDAKQSTDIDKGKILEIKVHQGYYQTIKRYIENSARLTITELHRILRLYSIDDIPDIADIGENFISIVVVPQPSVTLQDVVIPINISSVPQPSVEVMVLTVSIESVPQPSVTITDLPATLTSVPQPSITVIIISGSITHVPQPSIELFDVVQLSDITYVPQPFISTQQNAIIIMNVPQPVIGLTQVASQDEFFWGFTPYSSSLTRASYLAYMQTAGIIDLMLATNNYSTDGYLRKDQVPLQPLEDGFNMEQWDRNIPIGETSYMVFLIPAIYTGKSWSNSSGTGTIGGVLNESTAGNHWPDPDAVITYNGKGYNLYLGNRRRRNSGLTIIYV